MITKMSSVAEETKTNQREVRFLPLHTITILSLLTESTIDPSSSSFKTMCFICIAGPPITVHVKSLSSAFVTPTIY